jgi:hypothetical protein
MITTVFGDLTFGSDEGVKQWIDAHQQTHRAYAQALATAGVAYQNQILTGKIDRDWLGRHMLDHVTIEQALQQERNQADSNPDVMLGFEYQGTEAQFADWHQRHDDSHQRIDTALGINTSSF